MRIKPPEPSFIKTVGVITVIAGAFFFVAFFFLETLPWLLKTIFPSFAQPDNQRFLFLLCSAASAAAFIIWIIRAAQHNARGRRREMQQLARGLNLKYDARPFPKLLDALEPLRRRGGKRFKPENITHILSGVLKEDWYAIFNHEYSDGGDSGSSREIVYLIVSDKLDLPYFQTRGQSVFDRLFGQSDISLEQHPEFSRKYLLSGSKRRIPKIFNAQVTEFYEQNYPLETIGEGKLLCVVDPPKAFRLIGCNHAADYLLILEILSELFKSNQRL